MTSKEALVLALTLAIEGHVSKVGELTEMADKVAASMTDEEISACKRAAQAVAGCL